MSTNAPFADMGNRIRQLRERRGVKQAELAALLGGVPFAEAVRQSHISNLESGDGNKLPSVQVLVALVQILETNADYLLGLTNDDKPASDLEDQVVVGVKDPMQRAVIQELVDAVMALPAEDQTFVLTMVRKIVAPLKPRIIGQEP